MIHPNMYISTFACNTYYANLFTDLFAYLFIYLFIHLCTCVFILRRTSICQLFSCSSRAFDPTAPHIVGYIPLIVSHSISSYSIKHPHFGWLISHQDLIIRSYVDFNFWWLNKSPFCFHRQIDPINKLLWKISIKKNTL